ncbi:MAG TPA: hypothetical protein VJK05_04130 [archaeon]|nr:hypothetical protein [archaeon]
MHAIKKVFNSSKNLKFILFNLLTQLFFLVGLIFAGAIIFLLFSASDSLLPFLLERFPEMEFTLRAALYSLSGFIGFLVLLVFASFVLGSNLTAANDLFLEARFSVPEALVNGANKTMRITYFFLIILFVFLVAPGIVSILLNALFFLFALNSDPLFAYFSFILTGLVFLSAGYFFLLFLPGMMIVLPIIVIEESDLKESVKHAKELGLRHFYETIGLVLSSWLVKKFILILWRLVFLIVFFGSFLLTQTSILAFFENIALMNFDFNTYLAQFLLLALFALVELIVLLGWNSGVNSLIPISTYYHTLVLEKEAEQ